MTSNGNNELLPPPIYIKRIGDNGNNNILLLLPHSLDSIIKTDHISNDQLLLLPRDFFFQWMCLFSDNSRLSDDYRAIIYCFLHTEFCYVGGLARILNTFKQNLPNKLATLINSGVIQEVGDDKAKDRITLLRAHKRALGLTEANLKYIKLYELTPLAKGYFSRWPEECWAELLPDRIIRDVENWRHKLSKTHADVKKEIKKKREEQERQLIIDAKAYRQKLRDPKQFSFLQKWLKLKAENYGTTPEKLERLLKERMQ